MINVSADLTGVLPKYRPLFEAAISRMDDVLESPLFLKNFNEEISKSKFLEGELSVWRTYTPKQIYQQLFYRGNDKIHLTVLTYYTMKNVIGYGYSSTVDIYVNTKYLVNDSLDDLQDLCDIGSNLLHEHGHDAGFSHDFKATKRRPNSICYVLNRAYEKTFKEIYGLSVTPPAPVKKKPWWKRIYVFR